jgi:hypothetical protein
MLYIVRLLSKNAHFQAYFDFPSRNIDFQVKFIFQPEISDFWIFPTRNQRFLDFLGGRAPH